MLVLDRKEYPVLTRTGPGRWTPGYTLDDAVRIRRRLAAHEPATCPTCGDPMVAAAGPDTDGTIWLVRCARCESSVVLREPAAAAS